MLAALCVAAGQGSVDGLVGVVAARVPAAQVRGADVAVTVSGPPRLAALVADLLAQRLRAQGARSVTPIADADQAGAAGFEQVVQLALEPRGGKLVASGTLVSLPSGLWPGEAEARASLFAEAALDGELQALLPAQPARRGWETQRIALPDAEFLALDVGDADGDGRPELVAATADEALAFTVERGRAVEKWRLPLGGWPAPQRPRADVAAVAIAGGAVTARSSRWADGVRRQRAGRATPARGWALPGLKAACELEPGVDWFRGESCGAGELPERFYAAARLERRGVAAAVTPRAGGTLWLRVGAEVWQVPGVVGAQLALASLERGDYVVTTERAFAAADEAIVVRGLEPGGPVAHRLERLPGLVRALGAGDVDGDGRAEIAAIVRDPASGRTELWLVQ